MVNLKKEQTLDQKISLEERLSSNKEVYLGYSFDEAVEEASRCLNCKNKPCVEGCPLHNDIPGFISKIVSNDLDEAMSIINQTSPLPFACSRVCNQQGQCEGNCTRGKNGESVAIGKLERFVCDQMYDKIPMTLELQHLNGKRVAIVGAGPSGLACGEYLARNGFEVDIFDRLPFAGGLLIYGIPEFRLPNKLVEDKIKVLETLGVRFKLNTELGKDISLDQLVNDYDYVYLAFGADNAKSMRIENESIPGVYKSNDYLLLMNQKDENNELYKTFTNASDVVVTGGGNVAMDCARVARRNGANVTIVYRRSHEEMPAREDELVDALDEGIKVKFLTNPIKVNGQEHIESITCVEMELGESDESGRRRPVVKPNSEFDIKCDALIYAIGSNADIKLLSSLGIKYEAWGGVKVDENLLTTNPKVYAGGDLITGPNYVVHAVRDGLKVAKHIISKL